MKVQVKSIPHKFRNKYLRYSRGVTTSGTTSSKVQSAVKVLGLEDSREVSDGTLFSSKRTVGEIKTSIGNYDAELPEKMTDFIINNKAAIIELLKDKDGVLRLDASIEVSGTIKQGVQWE